MKITRTEMFVLGDATPNAHPLDFRYIEALPFVRIRTDEGLIGLSEVFSVPPNVAKAVLDGPDSLFGHLLVGEDPIPPERLWAKLYGSLLHANRRGWAVICLGEVDVALWDIFGQALGRPVYQLLGGAERSDFQIHDEAQRREVILCGTVVSHDWDRQSVFEQQLSMVSKLKDLGFQAVKVEPLHSTPDTVTELVRLAREVLGPERILCADVGYMWNDVGTAAGVCRELAKHDVFFLETPFPIDSIEAYGKLTAESPVRIAAGEHTVTRWEFLDLMDRGGIRVAQPYMTTCGGLTEAKRIVELAQPRGVLVCPGNWSTQVLGAATVHLAAASPITPLIEFTPSQLYPSPLRGTLQEIGLPIENAAVAFPTRPGIGVTLPDKVVAKFLME